VGVGGGSCGGGGGGGGFINSDKVFCWLHLNFFIFITTDFLFMESS